MLAGPMVAKEGVPVSVAILLYGVGLVRVYPDFVQADVWVAKPEAQSGEYPNGEFN
jgi:hypothetical protein